jgi:hypothetical protein
VKECWQRALGDVVGYRITGFGPVATTPRRRGAVHALGLTFANAQIIQLPGENGVHGPDRQRANDFHPAQVDREGCFRNEDLDFLATLSAPERDFLARRP